MSCLCRNWFGKREPPSRKPLALLPVHSSDRVSREVKYLPVANAVLVRGLEAVAWNSSRFQCRIIAA